MKKKIIFIVLIIFLIIFGISYIKEKKIEIDIDNEYSLIEKENLQKEIAINGTYYCEGDFFTDTPSYIFSPDKVELAGNDCYTGTYKINDDLIEIKYTSYTPPAEEISNEVYEEETLKIIDENTLIRVKSSFTDIQDYTIKYIKNLFNGNEDTILYLNVILGDEETIKATGEYAYKNVTITDRNIINILIEKINNAKIYEPKSFIPEFGDPPPTVEIYYSNGEKCSIFAGDEIDDNGKIVNLFAKWNSDDGNDKTIYKVNEKMAEYIEKIYEEKFAKETLQKYETLLPYQAKEVGAMPYLLAELGLDTKENLDKIIEDDENKSEYIKTNTKYTDFKNEMLKYVTEELFDKEYSHYIDMDGYVGIQDAACSWIPTTVLKVELTSKNENEYTFNATIRDDEMFEHYINRFENNENIEESDCYFEINVICKYVNSYLVVDKYDSQDL